MSQLSTKFAQTVSALSLAAAALVAPFNSAAQPAPVDHPLLKVPGIAFMPRMMRKAIEVSKRSMVDQEVPPAMHSTYQLRGEGVMATFEGLLADQLKADVAVIGADQRAKRESGATVLSRTTCDPMNPDDVAKDRLCSELDISIAAVVPKIGQEKTPIPVCIAQGIYPRQLIDGKVKKQVIYTGFILPNGDTQDEITSPRSDMVDVLRPNGKLFSACAGFIVPHGNRLNGVTP